MGEYLLSVYQAAGDPPAPAVLDGIRRDLDAAPRWAQRLARASTLPIEVRPFRDPRGLT